MKPFPRHGLTGKTRQRVFDALLARQQGKCFICGISQAEITAHYEEMIQRRIRSHPHETAVNIAERYRVHRTLHIEHCHSTGMIRGLLCGPCNLELGYVENYLFRERPLDITEEEFAILERAVRWLDQNKEIVLLYLQQDRWLPRQDILFHLQNSVSLFS